jgi:hypothetical protein
MKNVQTFESFNIDKKVNYIIDWSLYEGLIEYDFLNEKLHLVYSEHGKMERMKDFKIEPIELEEIIQLAAPEIIRQYDMNTDKTRIRFLIRDRSKNYPFELITVVDKGIEKDVVKTNIAALGEVYNKQKIDELQKKYRNRELGYDDPDRPFVKRILSKNLNIEEGDYVFQVITTRRKRNFLVREEDDIIVLEVFPNQTIKVFR